MKKTNITVAIADDHPIVITGIQALLERAPGLLPCGIAYSVPEIVNMLSERYIDVLLLDLNMPGNDYTKTLRDLRTRFPKLRVIIYTSYNEPDLVKSAIKLGAAGYLLKNTRREELLSAIQQVYGSDEVVIGSGVSLSKGNARSDTGEQPLQDNFQKRLRLSRREQEILVLIGKGLTSQGIGQKLFISKHTVETHRKNILRKLEFNSSTELVRFAVMQGII